MLYSICECINPNGTEIEIEGKTVQVKLEEMFDCVYEKGIEHAKDSRMGIVIGRHTSEPITLKVDDWKFDGPF